MIKERCGLVAQDSKISLQENQNVLNAPVPVQVKEKINYFSQIQVASIKSFNDKMDEVTALVTVCRQEFQLAPTFETVDRGPDFQARVRFETHCKFSQQIIATCAGPNKKLSKSIVAKLGLFKTAPNVYSAIFGQEAPPDDITDLASHKLAQ